MGHIFQMKPKIAMTYAANIGWLLLLVVGQLALVPASPQAAVDEYEYETTINKELISYFLKRFFRVGSRRSTC